MARPVCRATLGEAPTIATARGESSLPRSTAGRSDDAASDQTMNTIVMESVSLVKRASGLVPVGDGGVGGVERGVGRWR